MKLYVCYGTFWSPGARLRGHPCRHAHEALRKAGYQPEVERVYGLGIGPIKWTSTPGRRKVRELTGQDAVPVLVTDDGEAIADSKKIVDWAERNPAPERGGRGGFLGLRAKRN
jgi:glutathione S-transferase-like protein